MSTKILSLGTHSLFYFLLLFSFFGNAQDNPLFNARLADSLGADDYGMRAYHLVILKTGERKIDNKAVVDSLFAGHFTNMERMTKEGKLIVAGPISKNERTYRGIFIIRSTNKEETVWNLNADPAISSGLLAYEIYDWYGSAALPLYLPSHELVSRKKF